MKSLVLSDEGLDGKKYQKKTIFKYNLKCFRSIWHGVSNNVVVLVNGFYTYF